MDNLKITITKSLNNYFSALSKIGYISYDIVSELILCIFLYEVLNGLFDNIITEEDYKSIENCLYCIYGKNCLIPYPEYTRYTLTENKKDSILRITESIITRSAENNITRIVS